MGGDRLAGWVSAGVAVERLKPDLGERGFLDLMGEASGITGSVMELTPGRGTLAERDPEGFAAVVEVAYALHQHSGAGDRSQVAADIAAEAAQRADRVRRTGQVGGAPDGDQTPPRAGESSSSAAFEGNAALSRAEVVADVRAELNAFEQRLVAEIGKAKYALVAEVSAGRLTANQLAAARAEAHRSLQKVAFSADVDVEGLGWWLAEKLWSSGVARAKLAFMRAQVALALNADKEALEAAYDLLEEFHPSWRDSAAASDVGNKLIMIAAHSSRAKTYAIVAAEGWESRRMGSAPAEVLSRISSSTAYQHAAVVSFIPPLESPPDPLAWPLHDAGPGGTYVFFETQPDGAEIPVGQDELPWAGEVVLYVDVHASAWSFTPGHALWDINAHVSTRVTASPAHMADVVAADPLFAEMKERARAHKLKFNVVLSACGTLQQTSQNAAAAHAFTGRLGEVAFDRAVQMSVWASPYEVGVGSGGLVGVFAPVGVVDAWVESVVAAPRLAGVVAGPG